MGTLFYNKAIFAEAGIDKMPATWDEFLDCCQKIKDAGYDPITVDDAYQQSMYGHYLAMIKDVDWVGELLTCLLYTSHAQMERSFCRLINFSVQQAAARKNRSFIHRILYLKQSGFIDDCLPAMDKQLQIPAAQAAEIVHETAAFRPGSICRGKGSCAHACSCLLYTSDTAVTLPSVKRCLKPRIKSWTACAAIYITGRPFAIRSRAIGIFTNGMNCWTGKMCIRDRCKTCSGLGKVTKVDIGVILDPDKSWNEGCVKDSLYRPGADVYKRQV